MLKSRIELIVLVLACCVAPSLSMAAPLYWDTDDLDGLQFGAGVWSTATTNWNPQSDGLATRQTWTNGSDAVLNSTAAQVITLSGAVEASSITLLGPSAVTTLSGGNLILTGTGQINLNGSGSSANLSIGSQISGSVGLLKTGPRELILTNGTNNYTGNTLVQQGTLRLTGTNVLPATTVLIHNSTSVLQLTGNQTIAGLEGTGSMRPSGGNRTLTIGGGGDDSAYQGALVNGSSSNVININKVGAGTFAMNGNSTTLGTVTVNEGTLELNGNYHGNFVVNAAGTLSGIGQAGNTLDRTVNVNGGTLSPGNSAGVFNVAGDLNFTTGGSKLVIEITGSGNTPGVDFDQVVVNGNVTGTENVDLIVQIAEGTTLNPTDAVTIVTSGLSSLDGSTFNSIIVETDEYYPSIQAIFGNGQILLTNFQAVPIPEPSSLALLGLGSFLLTMNKRRRKMAGDVK